MGMTIDGLEKECQYCYREIDNSGLEGFRCTNRTAIKARDSSWCYPKNANEPCSICEYCKPKQNMGMTIDEAIEFISDIDKAYRTFSNMEYKAMQKSIDVMRKYQKIEQIIKDIPYGGDVTVRRIQEVVEDGTD